MSEELKNSKSKKEEVEALRKLSAKFYRQELLKNLKNAFLKWIAALIFTPIVVGFLTVLAKVCWYVIQWGWYLI